MKCVCGYEHRDVYFDNEVPVDNDPFVHIECMAIVREEWEPPWEVKLYACPECNTVQMSRH